MNDSCEREAMVLRNRLPLPSQEDLHSIELRWRDHWNMSTLVELASVGFGRLPPEGARVEGVGEDAIPRRDGVRSATQFLPLFRSQGPVVRRDLLDSPDR